MIPNFTEAHVSSRTSIYVNIYVMLFYFYFLVRTNCYNGTSLIDENPWAQILAWPEVFLTFVLWLRIFNNYWASLHKILRVVRDKLKAEV